MTSATRHRVGIDNRSQQVHVETWIELDVSMNMYRCNMITLTQVDKMDTQLIGAFFLMVLAWMGVTFDMSIPPWLPICLSAFSGSVQSLFARMGKGFVKGKGAMMSAFVGGMTGGLIIGYSIGVMMGLKGSIAIILPVYIFSLMGGRLVLYMSTGVSVEDIGNTIVGMFTRRKD